MRAQCLLPGNRASAGADAKQERPLKGLGTLGIFVLGERGWNQRAETAGPGVEKWFRFPDLFSLGNEAENRPGMRILCWRAAALPSALCPALQLSESRRAGVTNGL